MRLRRNLSGLLLFAAMGLLCLNAWGSVLPPHSCAYGNSLQGWLKTYWTWWLAGEPESGKVGRVMLLPLPSGTADDGAGTFDDPVTLTGHLDIQMKPGTPFVLPVVAWIGEMYEDGSVDPEGPDYLFGKRGFISGRVWIDGQPVITDWNVRRFYVPRTDFDEVIMYPEPTSYGAIGAVYTQSIGFVCGPLPVGVHHIQLVSTFNVPDFNIGVTYKNTWRIRVKP
jgi:hypothetical protein